MRSNQGKNERKGPSFSDFVKELYNIWISERPTQLAAALAYFGLFSFAPVIYIALRITGIFIDQADLTGRIMTKLEATFGPGIVKAIQELLSSVSIGSTGGSLIITLISFFFLLLAASGVFFQLQFALNTVWKVPTASEQAMSKMLRQRLFSFVMVIALGLLLTVVAALTFLANWLSTIFMLFGIQPSLIGLGFFVIAAVIFAILYKILPEVRISWRDVWIGAITAALLITAGGWIVIFLIQKTSLSSALEAAGSFVILLTGFYYFAQIFLLGAIITRVYARRYGSQRPPPADTTPVR